MSIPTSSELDVLGVDAIRARHTFKWTAHQSDVLPLWVAEMDYPTAEPIMDALRQAVERQEFGYPAQPQHTEIREAVAGWSLNRYGWQVDPERVHLLPDVVRGVELALDSFSPAGSPVILPAPAYHPFFAIAQKLGREVIQIPMGTEHPNPLNLEALEKALAAGAKTLLLCHPHNPLGTAMDAEELRRISQLVQRYGARVISDEIHAPLVYSATGHIPYASISDEAATHTITLVSASKAWNLAGLGCAQVILSNDADNARWLALPMVQTHGVTPLGVRANIAAYTQGGEWLDSVTSYLAGNRQLLGELLTQHIPQINYKVPEATYLGWLDCRALELPSEPADFFLEHAKVALSSGLPFGMGGTGHARLNFATTRPLIERAVESMADAIQKMRQ